MRVNWPHICAAGWLVTSASFLLLLLLLLVLPYALTACHHCVSTAGMGCSCRGGCSPSSCRRGLACRWGDSDRRLPIPQCPSCATFTPCSLLACYPNRHPLWRDLEILADPASTPRQKVCVTPVVITHMHRASYGQQHLLLCLLSCAALSRHCNAAFLRASLTHMQVAARLTKIEKSILQGCLDAVATCAPCLGASVHGAPAGTHCTHCTHLPCTDGVNIHCCTVLCCAALCCTVPCCAVLCYAVAPRHAPSSNRRRAVHAANAPMRVSADAMAVSPPTLAVKLA